ncbi:macrosialin [Rana temporaria]|uniref:macrosialin n=1 Tax=Rana temporaria TaxID=8407 RepID=UPI001AADDF8D|nr:macrosialin [Rana temporaria]
MDYLWRLFISSVLIAECFGDNQAVRPTSATMQITRTLQWCPKKTTTRHTTVAPTTAHTNHTTEPPTTAHTNHTTEPPTTAHTNHTTEPPTTAQTNHTTEPPTTAHTNHTTAHTNHTTAHTNHTTAHTNRTTQASTTSPSNHTSTPHTNQTTPPHTTPSPLPPPTEYFVNGTSEVCLRIKAVFMLTLDNTTIRNYTIPPPPTTKANGSCSPDTAELMLTFPNGSLALTFRKDKKKSLFYLDAINVTGHGEGTSQGAHVSLNGMSTPLGHSFTCKEVDLEVSSRVKLALLDVQAQAIELKGGNFGPEMSCSSPSRSKTVPIVVGIVLVVLIVVVVAAYVIARKIRHRSAGYQPL